MKAMYSLIIRRFMSSKNAAMIKKTATGGKTLVDKVAIADDGKMIVAWHPDVEFPYECSKPLPTVSEIDSSSLLKENAMRNAMSAYKNKHPEAARQELMNLTHTTKHRWFPRARDKKAKKTPMNRPYL